MNWDNSGYDPGTDFIGVYVVGFPLTGVELAVWNKNTSGWPGPGTNRTLYWTHENEPAIETKFWVGFFKGVDQTDPINVTTWTDVSQEGNTNATQTSALGTLASGDYGIMASYYWQHDGNATTSNTELHDSAVNDNVQNLYVAGDVDDTSIVVELLDYPVSVAFSLVGD